MVRENVPLIALVVTNDEWGAEEKNQVGDVMKEAIASGKPCMINALVQGGTEVLADRFRKDALEMPSRHLEKYAHLNAN